MGCVRLVFLKCWCRVIFDSVGYADFVFGRFRVWLDFLVLLFFYGGIAFFVFGGFCF